MPDESRIEAIDFNPFINSDAPTYAEVMAKILADEYLNPTKQRDMVSALRRILQLLDLDPDRTPASVAAIKKKLGLWPVSHCLPTEHRSPVGNPSLPHTLAQLAGGCVRHDNLLSLGLRFKTSKPYRQAATHVIVPAPTVNSQYRVSGLVR